MIESHHKNGYIFDMQKVMEKLAKLCQKTMGDPPNEVIKLQGDGSDRHIFRLSYFDSSYIGIYGANRAENDAFVAFTNHFYKSSIPVPKIFDYEQDEGIYIEEDLGDVTLCDYVASCCSGFLADRRLTNIYKKVIEWLPEFQISAGPTIDYSYCYQSLHFDYDAMMRDLLYFENSFLHVFKTAPYNKDKLAADFSMLASHLARIPTPFFMYRDFQSKNIMIMNEAPHFIDYQSGRKGALQYDLASLLFDAYVNIDNNFREEMIDFYLSTLTPLKIPTRDFKRCFNDFALLRVLQALAAFAFLSMVKGKRQFLSSIPNGLMNIEFLLQHSGIFLKMDELQRIFSEDILCNSRLREF